MTGYVVVCACGATATHPSYGTRTCTMPAGHQPPPDAAPTSTDGWHQSADGIRWATVQWLAFREEMAA